MLGSEVGGRWNEGARNFLRQLVRVRAHRAPPAIRAAAAAQAVASTALGGPWQQPLAAGHMLCCSGPTLPAQAAYKEALWIRRKKVRQKKEKLGKNNQFRHAQVVIVQQVPRCFFLAGACLSALIGLAGGGARAWGRVVMSKLRAAADIHVRDTWASALRVEAWGPLQEARASSTNRTVCLPASTLSYAQNASFGMFENFFHTSAFVRDLR